MHSDMYLYLRDKRRASRYDRRIMRVGFVLLFSSVVVFGFTLAYGIAMCTPFYN